jgi:hypothetical protein
MLDKHQDWYFHKIQIEGVIRSSYQRIKHARQTLRLSRKHIDQSLASLHWSANYGGSWPKRGRPLSQLLDRRPVRDSARPGAASTAPFAHRTAN